MQISDILFISLLIPFSTAHESLTVNCEGDHIKLSCMKPGNLTKNKVIALWKKSSGERVIWNYHGNSNKGDTFTNRTVRLNKDFSLSIDECSQSDQGRYILCINGEPSCDIMLFVNASKQCNKQKPTTDQSTKIPTGAEKTIQDFTDALQSESLPNKIKWGLCGTAFLSVPMVLWLAVFFQRKKTEFKQLYTATQIDIVEA